jgi:hypothetical protein
LVFIKTKKDNFGEHIEERSSEIYLSYEHTIKVDIRHFSFSIGINLGAFGFGISYSQDYLKIRERLNAKFDSTARFKTNNFNQKDPYIIQNHTS